MSIRSCLLCTKYSVFALNFIIWMTGLLILGLAIYLRMDPTYNNMAVVGYTQHTTTFHFFCYFLVFFGTIVTFLGFLGCCSSYQESFSMLGLFISVLVLFLIAEVGMASWLVMQKNNIKISVSETMQKYIYSNYGDDIFTDDPIDHIQDSFKCCGSVGPDDYLNSKWSNSSKTSDKQQFNHEHHHHAQPHNHHSQHPQQSKLLQQQRQPHQQQSHLQQQHQPHQQQSHLQQQPQFNQRQQNLVPISCCGVYNMRKKTFSICYSVDHGLPYDINKALDISVDDNDNNTNDNNNNNNNSNNNKIGDYKSQIKRSNNNKYKNNNNNNLQSFKNGCSGGITSLVDRTIKASCVLALVVAAIQVLTLVMSLCLCCSLRRQSAGGYKS